MNKNNILMMNYKKRFILLVWISLLSFVNAAPKVFWISEPVDPGRTVMICGGGWGDSPSLEFGGEKVDCLTQSDSCLTFVYPESLPMTIQDGVITGSTNGATLFSVNSPEVWWLHGDWGEEASAGGWLRVFGRCLSFNDKASITVKGAGKSISLAISEGQNCWSVKALLPDDLQPGKYDVSIRNGLSDKVYYAGSIVIKPHEEVWKKKVFDATDYGAFPSDGFDDTKAIVSALEAIKVNGGGVLYFPRGRYGFAGTLEIPEYTLIRGEVSGDMQPAPGTNPDRKYPVLLSQLYWQDTDNPPEALIQGDGNFGIEDIAITSGFHHHGIVANGDNVTIRRISMRLVYRQYLLADVDEQARREATLRGVRSMELLGNFVRVTDCDINGAAGGTISLIGNYNQVSGNTFSCGAFTYGGFGGRQVIVENNEFLGNHCLSLWDVRRVYYGENYLQDAFDNNNQEAVTSDGGLGGFGGNPISTDGVSLTFAGSISGRLNSSSATVEIVDGTGKGQRRVVREMTRVNINDGKDRISKVLVEEPWDIQPDKTSVCSIRLGRKQVISFGNRIDDATVAWQFFNGMFNSVVASNMTSRTSGFSIYSHGVNMYSEFLGNRVFEGNGMRGPENNIPAVDGGINIDGRSTFGVIVRDNVLESNARIGLKYARSVVVENNTIKNAETGVDIKSAHNTIVRHNSFMNVDYPYIGINEAVMNTGETEYGCLSGAATQLGQDSPEIWSDLLVELKNVIKESAPDEQIQKKVEAIMLRAIQALSDKYAGKSIDGDAVKTLLGLSIGCPNWNGFQQIFAEGQAGEGSLMVYLYSSLSEPMTVDFVPVAIPGWEISDNPPVTLAAGKQCSQHIRITKPEGLTGRFSLPVSYRITGDGWGLNFSTKLRYGGRYPCPITEFLVAGPFENRSGESNDTTIHPPEMRLDVRDAFETRDGIRSWVPSTGNLGELFETSAQSVACAVAVLRATREVPVVITFSGNGSGMICMLNGKRLGTSLQRGNWGSVVLNKGDNILMLISTNGNVDKWNIKASYNIPDSVLQGELIVVPVEELPNLPVLHSTIEKPQEGKSLPNSNGFDWTLRYEDNFNRERIGTGCRFTPWHGGVAKIENGELQSPGYITLSQSVSVPIRIDADIIGSNWLGVILDHQGLSDDRRFWRGLHGDGYFISLGWHNPQNRNCVMRNSEEVMVAENVAALTPNKRQHLTAMFIPPICQVYVDGEKVLEYKDNSWIEGLNELALFYKGKVDNLRVYEAEK